MKLFQCRNTALVIENKSNETASVDLYVTGDTGLSMGYKKLKRFQLKNNI
jgi:hypothetical protein